jgi:hypothetical protein
LLHSADFFPEQNISMEICFALHNGGVGADKEDLTAEIYAGVISG